MEELHDKGGSPPLYLFHIYFAKSPLAWIDQECRGHSDILSVVERGFLYRSFRLLLFHFPQGYIPFGETKTGIGEDQNAIMRRRDGSTR